jgi:hypothetical protein
MYKKKYLPKEASVVPGISVTILPRRPNEKSPG